MGELQARGGSAAPPGSALAEDVVVPSVVLEVSAGHSQRVARGYDGPAGRDRRIDILRGGALVLLTAEIVAQILTPTDRPFESTGTVSALALIVVTEGALVGMLHRPRLAAGGLGEVIHRLWRRSWAWYVAALALPIGMLLLRLIPAVDSPALAELFAGTKVVLSYPLDPSVVPDILLLRLGPWPFDIVAVLCVLFALAPLGLWALGRGRWPLLLLVSGILYAVEIFTQLRIFPTQAEASLPLLGWQAVFVVGMISGYYRRELVQWFRQGTGRTVFVILLVAAAIWITLPWFISLHIGPLPSDLLSAYAGSQSGWLFEPSAPGPVRLVVASVIVVVSYGLLTALWRPLNAVFGWLLAPLGAKVLVSLVLLIVVSLLLVSITVLWQTALAATAVTGIVVAALWLTLLLAQLAAKLGASR